jgi:hypothetical protein
VSTRADDLPGQPIHPDERPDLYREHWLLQLEGLLRNWHRRRGVLVGRDQPGPLDACNFVALRAAELNESVPESLDAHGVVEWLYWRDIVRILQMQANLNRIGLPSVMELGESSRLLADFNDYIADILRGQLQGKIHSVFRRARKHKYSPRQYEAVAKAVAAARLQVEQGIFRNVHDADTRVADLFGISYSVFDKQRQASPWRSLIKGMRHHMEKRSGQADRATFLLEVIQKAADEFREEEV